MWIRIYIIYLILKNILKIIIYIYCKRKGITLDYLVNVVKNKLKKE